MGYPHPAGVRLNVGKNSVIKLTTNLFKKIIINIKVSQQVMKPTVESKINFFKLPYVGRGERRHD